MYEYNRLSPLDFEELVRDLIQVKDDIYVESFTTGRDGGIDLRFSNNDESDTIIQCKHYTSGYSNLKSRLKKERSTIISKGYKNYILATSVGLTPNNKAEIVDLLKPLEIETQNILGKDDLNNIISNNKQIELKHFKLWYASTNVLQRILNNRIHAQSQIEKEEILEKIKFYVQNNSYEDSLRILQENNFVIISGIPGIGKTTLARLLVFNLLIESEYEFINISANINDGFDLLDDNTKQIFLFDDFLGRNFLKSSLSISQEKGIVQFIKKVQNSKNKLLIFTTREYILNQALDELETLNQNIEGIERCIIELADYTNLIKAKILYNHLYFNNVSNQHVKSLFKDDSIINIIDHSNYNPRIIELVTKESRWKKVEPESFNKYILNTLDNPFDIWKTAYQHHISKLSQIILKIIYTTGTPILYADLYSATDKYIISDNSINESFDEIEFDKSINELENSFLSTLSDDKDTLTIDFQNPSIQDFLYHYFEANNSLIKILKFGQFSNQLYESVVYEATQDDNYSNYNYIDLNQESLENLFDNYLTKQESIVSRSSFYSGKIRWIKFSSSKPKRLYFLLKRGLRNNTIRKVVSAEFQNYIDESHSFNFDDSFYMFHLIKELKDELVLDINEVLLKLGDDPYLKQYLDDFVKFKEIYPSKFKEYFEEREQDILDAIIESELNGMDSDNVESVKDSLQEIELEYNLDLTETISELLDQEDERENSNENLIESSMSRNLKPLEELFNDSEIESMFSNLMEEE